MTLEELEIIRERFQAIKEATRVFSYSEILRDYLFAVKTLMAEVERLTGEILELKSVRAEVGASSRLENICPGPDICQGRIAELRARLSKAWPDTTHTWGDRP